MQILEPTVLLISQDADLCSAVRNALKRSEPSCRIASVANFAAARHTVAQLSPDVIVLQESSLQTSSSSSPSQLVPLADMVTSLAGFAPVVIFGKEEAPASLSALIAAGAADFVNADELHFPDAAASIEKRISSARRLCQEHAESKSARLGAEVTQEENFGEILRHELNNPLTGILGNAELLLAEVRRHPRSQLSEAWIKRLETVAALAVRMRETVHRLSQACDSHVEHARSH
jgi:signal transduction histidine kinase